MWTGSLEDDGSHSIGNTHEKHRTRCRRGANVLIQTGSVTDYVEFDHVEIDTKINGLPIYNSSIPYDQAYDSGDVLTFRYGDFVVSFAPSGAYTNTLTFKDKNGKAQGCFSFSFKI